ncbi:MAG: ABC transporter substrate-binding protein [Acidimicrobiia bacterium]|nr:ABC transporter substrate-binding protein [Acidimicrobiia bacterium]
MTARIAIMVSILGLVLTACSTSSDEPTTTLLTSSEGPVFVGADGVGSDVSDTSRIVVLNGDLVEVIFALGAGDRVVGRDLTTTYPPEALAVPDVGLGRILNAEAVIGLAPTLVIGDTQIEPLSAIEQIRAAGIPVVILDLQSTLPGVSRKIEEVADILGLDDEGVVLAREVEADIQAALDLAAQAPDSPRVGYMYVRGPETLLMFGNGMPTHFLIEAAGGIDAFGEAGVTFAQPLDAELLVAAEPEVLITPIEGFDLIGGIDAFLALPGVSDTPAGAARAVITYDEALFLGMGPRTGEALMQLVLDLHPELATP